MVYLKAMFMCSKQWDNNICTLLLVPNVQIMFSSKLIYFLCNTNVIPYVAFAFLCATVLSLLHQHRSTRKKTKEKYWQKSYNWPKYIYDFMFRPFTSVLFFSLQPEISSLPALFVSFAPYLKICSQKCRCIFHCSFMLSVCWRVNYLHVCSTYNHI